MLVYIFKILYEGCILTETFVRREKDTKLRKGCGLCRSARRVKQSRLRDVSQIQIA